MNVSRLVSGSVVVSILVLTGCSDQISGPVSDRADPVAGVRGGPSGGSVAPASGPPGGSPGHATTCDLTVPTDATTIQGAVDAAPSGAVVCVMEAGGPYEEQVTIDKDLVLRSPDGAEIVMPSDAAEVSFPETGRSAEPIVFAYGGSRIGTHVSGSGVIDADVEGFVLNGRDYSPDANRVIGILYRNASGSISENTIENLLVGERETIGILVYGDSKVTVSRNVVDGYERGGIGANGDGGVHPAPRVRIIGNEVSGSTDLGEAWAPNGIQIGFGASGRIVGNTVRDNRYTKHSDKRTANDWAASCILVFESDDVQVRENEVFNCDVGIGGESWAWFNASVDNLKIVRNEVTDALAGVVLRSVAFDGFSTTDPSASNGKVVRNELAGGIIGEVGIAVAASDFDPDIDPIVDDNKVIDNRIDGFATEVDDTGSETKIHANTRPSAMP